MGGGEHIGVYGLTGASSEALPARRGLNQRVDYFIQNGEPLDGRLQMLVRVDGEEQLVPPSRAALMFLRLLDVQGDIAYWLNEECLACVHETIVQGSLIEELVYLIRSQLDVFNEILQDRSPFNFLMDNGTRATDDDFTDDEYERMHEYFGRYVDFVEEVLNPWRDACEADDAFLQGPFWPRRLGDVVAFRFFVEAQINPGVVTVQSAAFLTEAERRMNFIDQGPLHILIALAIMDEQLNGMHGVWRELRDCLNESGNEGMESYTEAIQVAVLGRLEVLNALLVPEELLPINGYRVNQVAFNRRVLELHRMLRNSMVLLFRYANEDTRREGDWSAFEQTGQSIDAFVAEHFPLVAPLEIEDPEGSDSETEDDAMREDRDEGEEDGGEDYLDADERAWWGVYGPGGLRYGGTDSTDSSEDDAVNYPEEEEDAMNFADDDEVEAEEEGILVDGALRAGINAVVPAATTFFAYVYGRHGYGGCR